ncbi:hypothetical protein BJY24_007737 [Nocardia transvalensis]|uniref:Uncharacterized protein n=1 Tax=Nocardia transvalensis TaxID=37333 RepID=A0A7W9UNH4_9NOCA|nr:hypothetical protein [Nocardia transvalensis]MBB5918825.1 hypothetical protein [Nocardia transvalensis]
MKSDPLVLTLSLCLVIAVGIICGMLAGFLSWIGGAKPANAALRGGAAFGGTVGLGVAVIAAL